MRSKELLIRYAQGFAPNALHLPISAKRRQPVPQFLFGYPAPLIKPDVRISRIRLSEVAIGLGTGYGLRELEELVLSMQAWVGEEGLLTEFAFVFMPEPVGQAFKQPQVQPTEDPV